jgi:hypothetical protein
MTRRSVISLSWTLLRLRSFSSARLEESASHAKLLKGSATVEISSVIIRPRPSVSVCSDGQPRNIVSAYLPTVSLPWACEGRSLCEVSLEVTEARAMITIISSLTQERNHIVPARVDALIEYALNIFIRLKVAETNPIAQNGPKESCNERGSFWDRSSSRLCSTSLDSWFTSKMVGFFASQ